MATTTTAAPEALLAKIVLEEFLDLAAALADEPDHRHVGGREARHHGEQHRLADAGAGEDAHALAAAGGQEGVDGPDAEIERLGDAAARMRRRRIGPEGIDGAALRQRPLAVDGAAEGVDDTAEPGVRRLHAVHAHAHMRRAAAAHALQGPERHGERPLAREADHLAGNDAAIDLDVEPPAEMHRRNRSGNLDEEAAHGGDAPEHAELVNPFQRRRCRRDPAHRLVLRLHCRINLSFTRLINTGREEARGRQGLRAQSQVARVGDVSFLMGGVSGLSQKNHTCGSTLASAAGVEVLNACAVERWFVNRSALALRVGFGEASAKSLWRTGGRVLPASLGAGLGT